MKPQISDRFLKIFFELERIQIDCKINRKIETFGTLPKTIEFFTANRKSFYRFSGKFN
jgi:hypothetical protein